MDIIRTVYYIHSPDVPKRIFCCFICVSYGPYTLLQNDSFLHLYIYESLVDIYVKIFKILFAKFTSRHRSTLLCAKFVKIVRREIVRYSCDQQKSTISAPSQTDATARIAPKVCRWQPPTFGSQSSKLHPDWFNFGGVIAGRLKAVKTRLKVFPILGETIAISFSPSNN